MNQIQTLIDAAREALTSTGIHDTILAVGIAAIPILIFCVIVNRLRHPDRSFLAALAVSVLGFFLVPSVGRWNRYPLGLHRRRGWTGYRRRNRALASWLLALSPVVAIRSPIRTTSAGGYTLTRPRTRRASRRKRAASR